MNDNLENTSHGELSTFYAWFVKNRSSLNVDKTNYIMFSTGKMYNNFLISINHYRE